MKRLFILVFILIMAGCFHNIPPPDMDKKQARDSYSYQGPVDPGSFKDWEVIDQNPIHSPAGIFYDVYLHNPDSSGPVEYVNALVGSRGIVVYFLVRDCIFYEYIFNDQTRCYERKNPIDEETLEQVKKDFQTYFGLRCE